MLFNCLNFLEKIYRFKIVVMSISTSSVVSNLWICSNTKITFCQCSGFAVTNFVYSKFKSSLTLDYILSIISGVILS